MFYDLGQLKQWSLPESPKEGDHNDTKKVSSNWTLFVEQVEMQHYDQNSKALQSWLLE